MGVRSASRRAACGLFGLKPSRGRVPHAPAIDVFAYPVGCIHALTRTVRDSAALLDAVAGPDPGRRVRDRGPRPPVPRRGRRRTWSPSDRVHHRHRARRHRRRRPDRRGGAHRRSVRGTRTRGERGCVHLRRRGHQRRARRGDVGERGPRGRQRLAVLGRTLADDDLEPFTHVLYQRGRAMPGTEVIKSLRELERAGRTVAPFFDTYDLLLTPTLSVRVPSSAGPTPPGPRRWRTPRPSVRSPASSTRPGNRR